MANGLWNRDRLQQLAKQRLAQRARLQPVEKAILAYARWQGMTDENNVDTTAAKAELDRLTDAMDPKHWEPLAELVGTIDDQVLRGLMSYSMQRSVGQLRDQAKDLATPESAAPKKQPRKSKKRDKDR
ncbi:MAG: hypothetical protein ACKVP7_04255 [Hyphomicrobiaceae bacterium]